MSQPSNLFSAVALLDCLGFRGILKRYPADLVMQALRNVRSEAQSTKVFSDDHGGFHHYRHWPATPRLHVGWFSDTMFIVAQPPTEFSKAGEVPDAELQAHLVDIVAMSVGYCLRAAAQEASMPIAFRGAITAGFSIVTDDNIYLGAAIEEAAEAYETADGAFVWLSLTARTLPVDTNRRQGPLVPYSVPFKGGRVVDTCVINPFVHTASGSDAGLTIRRGIETAMSGNRPDIVAKRENTVRFLDHVVDTEPGAIQRGARPWWE